MEGWFTAPGDPRGFRLLGTRCRECGTVSFPRQTTGCANPVCGGDELAEHALSPRGRIWSYTDCRYRPPAPYSSDPEREWEPYALVAVELEAERMVVLGQAPPGVGVADLAVGMEAEAVPGELHGGRRTWHWRPLPAGEGART
ncbi:zinc ribbon domain-containing protein [Streptomyces sp. NPDC051940]|uniref:Zn-ribbon domain-containing OB-fold protein n=1 Tax=Streptomyces sp. NPDC051940 TaxID=3155675 RepID=UPI003442B5B7